MADFEFNVKAGDQQAARVLAELLAKVNDIAAAAKVASSSAGDFKKELKAAGDEGAQAANKATDSLRQAADQTDRAAAGADRATTGFRGLASAAGDIGPRLQQSLGLTEQQLGSILQSGQTTGLAIAGVGAAFLGVAGASVFAASQQQSAFTSVIKTVDATDEQIENLRKSLLSLSGEIPVSFSELAELASLGGQLGISTDALLGFTKTVAGLGVATNLTNEQAGTFIARFASITGLPEEQFENLASSIVAVGNNSKTTEADIAAMAIRLAATGSIAGLTQPQIIGIAASLSSLGLEAEAGGSAMSKLIIRIASAAASGGKDLADLSAVAGQTSEQFRKSFEQDAIGAIQAFLGGINKLQESGGNVFGLLENLGISEIRLRNAVLSAAAGFDSFAASTDLATRSFEENTALARETELRFADLDQVISALGAELADLSAAFGRPLIEPLTAVVATLKDAAGAMAEFAEESPRAAGAITGLITVIGASALAAGTLLFSLTKTVELLIRARGALAALAGVQLSGLVGAFSQLASFGLPALLAGGAIAVTLDNLDKLKTRLDGVTERFEEIEKLQKKLQQAGLPAIDRRAGESVDDFARRLAGVVESLDLTTSEFGELDEALQVVVGSASRDFSDAADKMVSGLERIRFQTKETENGLESFLSLDQTIEEIARLEGLRGKFENDSAEAKILDDNIQNLTTSLGEFRFEVEENKSPLSFDKQARIAQRAAQDLAAEFSGLQRAAQETVDAIQILSDQALRDFEESVRRADFENVSRSDSRVDVLIDQANDGLGDLTVKSEQAARGLTQVSTIVTGLGRDLADAAIGGKGLADVFTAFGRSALRVVLERSLSTITDQLTKLIDKIPGLRGLAGTIAGLGGVIAGAVGGVGAAVGATGGSILGGAIGGPIGSFIGAAGGGFLGNVISGLFSKSSITKLINEAARDFGGVKAGREFVEQFLSAIGLDEKGLEGIRKDISSSPTFLLNVLLPAADSQGLRQQFLQSLEEVGNIFGSANLRAPLEFGLATGDFESLNKTFQDLFGQSNELTRRFGEDLEQLLATGFEPLSGRIQQLIDAGNDLGSVFQQLRPEITLQIAAADKLGVTLDPLIEQFRDLAGETADLTDRQLALLLSFRMLRDAPAQAAKGIEDLLADVEFLIEQGASSDEIISLLGESLVAAGEGAEQFDLVLPELVQSLIDMANSADNAGSEIENIFSTDAERRAAGFADGIKRVDESIGNAIDSAFEAEGSISRIVDLLEDAGASGADAFTKAFDDFGETLIGSFNTLFMFGLEIPEGIQAIIDRASELSLITIDDLGFVQLRQEVDNVVEQLSRLEEFQARGATSAQDLITGAGDLAAEFSGFAREILQFGGVLDPVTGELIESERATGILRGAVELFLPRLISTAEAFTNLGLEIPTPVAELLTLAERFNLLSEGQIEFVRQNGISIGAVAALDFSFQRLNATIQDFFNLLGIEIPPLQGIDRLATGLDDVSERLRRSQMELGSDGGQSTISSGDIPSRSRGRVVIDIPSAADGASVIKSGLVNVHSGETITPASVARFDRDQPVTVTLNVTINGGGGNADEIDDVMRRLIRQELTPTIKAAIRGNKEGLRGTIANVRR